MTYDNATAGDQGGLVSDAKSENEIACLDSLHSGPDASNDVSQEGPTSEASVLNIESSHTAVEQQSTNKPEGEKYHNQVLEDEIRSRLDNLNALSDLINSLERQFDEANGVFREILKCSTDRLSSIAKALGNKSIRQGRIYHAAKISVEQSQSDCQRACVQFEQANEDHQSAKKAIKEAESKLREIANENVNGVIVIPNVNLDSIDVSKLRLNDDLLEGSTSQMPNNSCDRNTKTSCTNGLDANVVQHLGVLNNKLEPSAQSNDAHLDEQYYRKEIPTSSNCMIKNSAKLSEELNQAIMRLIKAEEKRGQSERQHLDKANELMIAQENLIKMEREYGPSIRRSQFYFDESRRFNAKLNSVKGDICRINENILAAKQAYARTLSELERFSDDLHDNS